MSGNGFPRVGQRTAVAVGLGLAVLGCCRRPPRCGTAWSPPPPASASAPDVPRAPPAPPPPPSGPSTADPAPPAVEVGPLVSGTRVTLRAIGDVPFEGTVRAGAGSTPFALGTAAGEVHLRIPPGERPRQRRIPAVTVVDAAGNVVATTPERTAHSISSVRYRADVVGADTASATATLTEVDAIEAGGDPPFPAALRIDYAVGPGAAVVRFLTQSMPPNRHPVVPDTESIGAWIHGDGGGLRVATRVTYAGGRVVQHEGPRIDWTGWRWVEIPIEPGAEWIDGAEGPLVFVGSGAATRGRLYLHTPALIVTPAPATPASPSLPQGCVRLSDGVDASVSPSGRLLVFRRLRTIFGQAVEQDAKAFYSERSAEPLVPQLWARDLRTGREWRVPGRSSAGADRVLDPEVPLRWTPEGALLLSRGTILDPVLGGTPTTRRPPAGESTRVGSWAWSPDGRRFAYVGDVPGSPKDGIVRQTLFVEEEGKDRRRIDVPATSEVSEEDVAGIYFTLMGARLAWSPAGEVLFGQLDLHRVGSDGPEEFERTVLLWPTRGETKALAEWRHLDGAPWAGPGEDDWDDAGTRVALVGPTSAGKAEWGKPWRGTCDVYVVDAAKPELRRLTRDGVRKGHACIDPAGRRVAFFVGEEVARGGGPLRTRLRVVEVDGDGVWETDLARAPDEWCGLDTLRWAPDGRSLFYAYGGIEGAVYRQEVPEGAR